MPEGKASSDLSRIKAGLRDPSLTVLLVVQVVTTFALIPASAAGFPLPAGASRGLLLGAMLLTVLTATNGLAFGAGVFALSLAAVSETLLIGRDDLHALVASESLALATYVMLSVVVFGTVYRPGRLSAHRVRGAVVLYLNIGLSFALLHRVMAEILPGSYVNLPFGGNTAAFRAAANYFSFATLTSVGFGDIVPVHPIARSMATLEAAVGQLFPATLLARAVTLSISAATVDGLQSE